MLCYAARHDIYNYVYIIKITVIYAVRYKIFVVFARAAGKQAHNKGCGPLPEVWCCVPRHGVGSKQFAILFFENLTNA
jgi:hypothetical protein